MARKAVGTSAPLVLVSDDAAAAPSEAPEAPAPQERK